LPTPDELKELAALAAVDQLRSGIVLGLGAGSTSLKAHRIIGERLRSGKLRSITGVPCSKAIADAAREYGIPIGTLQSHPVIDITIDGADEVDPYLNLIKGGGGAHVSEKEVARATKREIIIVDESKLSPVLGTKWPVPCEILEQHVSIVSERLKNLGAEEVRRRLNPDGSPFISDHGNPIVDAHFGLIPDPEALSLSLDTVQGLVGHGIFSGLASEVIVAGGNGIRRIFRY